LDNLRLTLGLHLPGFFRVGLHGFGLQGLPVAPAAGLQYSALPAVVKELESAALPISSTLGLLASSATAGNADTTVNTTIMPIRMNLFTKNSLAARTVRAQSISPNPSAASFVRTIFA